MKKDCKTCRFIETDPGPFAWCSHPRNRQGGCANFDWMIDKCIDKNYKYWKSIKLFMKGRINEMKFIRAKTKTQQFKKDAIGLAEKSNEFEVRIKFMNAKKKRELIKLLGERASEFLDIIDNKYRLYMASEDCNDLSSGALGVFETENLQNFEIVEKKKLTKVEKQKIDKMLEEFSRT